MKAEPLILKGRQKKIYLKLKDDDPEAAKAFYEALLDQHRQGELLQKKKRKEAGSTRTLKSQQREYWDNWESDLCDKKERTRFINHMVEIGLATNPRTVRDNVKEWEGRKKKGRK